MSGEVLTDNIGNASVIVLLVHTDTIMYVIGQYVHLLCMGRCEHQYKKVLIENKIFVFIGGNN